MPIFNQTDITQLSTQITKFLQYSQPICGKSLLQSAATMTEESNFLKTSIYRDKIFRALLRLLSQGAFANPKKSKIPKIPQTKLLLYKMGYTRDVLCRELFNKPWTQQASYLFSSSTLFFDLFKQDRKNSIYICKKRVSFNHEIPDYFIQDPRFKDFIDLWRQVRNSNKDSIFLPPIPPSSCFDGSSLHITTFTDQLDKMATDSLFAAVITTSTGLIVGYVKIRTWGSPSIAGLDYTLTYKDKNTFKQVSFELRPYEQGNGHADITYTTVEDAYLTIDITINSFGKINIPRDLYQIQTMPIFYNGINERSPIPSHFNPSMTKRTLIVYYRVLLLIGIPENQLHSHHRLPVKQYDWMFYNTQEIKSLFAEHPVLFRRILNIIKLYQKVSNTLNHEEVLEYFKASHTFTNGCSLTEFMVENDASLELSIQKI